MTKKKEAPGNDSGPVVYCGPDIPGAARQYTVYYNGIPSPLAEILAEKPALRGLLFPLERLPEARESIGRRSGPIHSLYLLANRKEA